MTLVDDATGIRHPIVSPPARVPPTAADPSGIVHASVARDDRPDRSAGGGVGHDAEAAEAAAVGEALERFAATHASIIVRTSSELERGGHRVVRLADCTLHSAGQRSRPEFPHAASYPVLGAGDDEWCTPVFDLLTNEPCWVPAALVSLTDTYGALATSSGLAAAPSVMTALLRATQELVERDAYVTTWLHQLGGREVATPPVGFGRLGEEMRVFDLTPAFSPHRVAMVTGSEPQGGCARVSVGLAARASWTEAVDKAALECVQGIVFAGHLLAQRPDLRDMHATKVTGFDEHAVFYSANPPWWDAIPIHRFAIAAEAPGDSAVHGCGHGSELTELVHALATNGVDLYYRELSTPDVRQLGMRVVRVVAPALTPLHHDHRWPFLGGRSADVIWRYPDAARRGSGRPWPSPFPHALG